LSDIHLILAFLTRFQKTRMSGQASEGGVAERSGAMPRWLARSFRWPESWDRF